METVITKDRHIAAMLPERIIIPDAKEVLEIERKLKGERLELFQKSFDVLHEKGASDALTLFDDSTDWKLDNLNNLLRGFKRVEKERPQAGTRPAGCLGISVFNNKGQSAELGLASVNVVTTAGVNYVIDALQNIVEPENLKFHGSGTSSTAEAVGDTTLGTEVDSRSTGTTVEGASANIYRSVGTNTYSTTRAIVEHGLFSASTSGTLFDRSVFSVINASTTVSIQFTYEWTLNSGG